MGNTYDVEVTQKLKGVVDMFESDLFTTMRKGVESCVEYGQEANSKKLVDAAEAAQEGTEQMIAVFAELCENARQYIGIVERADEAFN